MQRLPAIIVGLLATLSSARCRTKYVIADFDDINARAFDPIPRPYASVAFFGFDASPTGPNYFNAVSPPSRKNVAYANDLNRGYLVQAFHQGPPSNGDLFGLESFYFACIAIRKHGSVPLPCSLTLTSKGDVYQPIDSKTYNFKPHGVKNGRSKMQYINSADISRASELYFDITAGPSDVTLVLDNLNISQRYANDYNKACK